MGKGGFSWKRAIGITRAKKRVSRATGIPWSKSGRQRKIGGMLTGGGGCMIIVCIAVSLPILALFILT